MNDDGDGSLRCAIIASNSDGVPSTIAFNVPTGDPGFNGRWFTIRRVTAWPDLTGGDLTIDGMSQTHSDPPRD